MPPDVAAHDTRPEVGQYRVASGTEDPAWIRPHGSTRAARGESAAQVETAVSRAMPGDSVHIATEDGLIHATVTAPAAEVPLLRSFTVHAESYEADEAALGSENTDADPGP